MKITTTADGVSIDFETDTNRRCGACTLCCKLLPNVALAKPSGQRCRHQRHGKGCAIYAKRPFECESWSCRWLAATDETLGMRRPDRAHYVVDALLDKLRLVENETGKGTEIDCLQIWVDPAFPKTRDDPELRAYMLRMAETHHVASLLRWSSRDATVIFPPPLNQDGQWHERDSGCSEDVGLFSRLSRSIQTKLGDFDG
jgi:hypothetical protein